MQNEESPKKVVPTQSQPLSPEISLKHLIRNVHMKWSLKAEWLPSLPRTLLKKLSALKEGHAGTGPSLHKKFSSARFLIPPPPFSMYEDMLKNCHVLLEYKSRKILLGLLLCLEGLKECPIPRVLVNIVGMNKWTQEE